MNGRQPEHQPAATVESPLSAGSPRTAAPRTLVNSSATAPYVPSKSVLVRAGADSHKLHPTKGQPA